MEKPNLEKLALVFAPDWDSRSNHFLPLFTKEWGEISEGKKSYQDIPLLESFLQENGMVKMLPDFQFMAFTFNKWNQVRLEFSELHLKSKHLNKGLSLELLKALKMFAEYKEDLTLIIKHSKYKDQFEIKNETLIMVIYESLHNYLKEIDEVINYKTPTCEDVSDWGKYLDKRIREEKPKAGRKKTNHYIRRYIFYLWKYLQEYTDIKALEGAGYSNSQARFIFDFLKICGLIERPDLISNEEDFIGFHLKDYKKSRREITKMTFEELRKIHKINTEK